MHVALHTSQLESALVGSLGVSYTCCMSMEEPAQSELQEPLGPGKAEWQRRWYDVIFEHESDAGRWFDLVLLVVIVASVLAVMLESVADLKANWGPALLAIEWVITILFSIEFIARLACVNRPAKYVFSFFGLVDIISLLPSYLGLFMTGAQSLATIRTLRLLRVFRILKLARHVKEAQGLLRALQSTWPKITVFISVVICMIVILGSVMYLVEAGSGSGFENIPVSVYWAIVTMTGVGYGDITPVSTLGKVIASIAMLLGYAIIIVPIGVFGAQIVTKGGIQLENRKCNGCGHTSHEPLAKFCNRCGVEL